MWLTIFNYFWCSSHLVWMAYWFINLIFSIQWYYPLTFCKAVADLLVIVMISFFFLVSLGLTESIYVAHKDEYTEFEQASLRQLYQSKVINMYIIKCNLQALFLCKKNSSTYIIKLICCADGWTESRGEATIWVNWLNWTCKRRIFDCITTTTDICHCSNRICPLEWGSHSQMHNVVFSGWTNPTSYFFPDSLVVLVYNDSLYLMVSFTVSLLILTIWTGQNVLYLLYLNILCDE